MKTSGVQQTATMIDQLTAGLNNGHPISKKQDMLLHIAPLSFLPSLTFYFLDNDHTSLREYIPVIAHGLCKIIRHTY